MKRLNNCRSIFLVVCMSFTLLFWVPTDAQSIIPDAGYDLAMGGKFVFDPKTQRWNAIDSHGHVVRSGHGSAGRDYCPDIHRRCHTPTGRFHVVEKRGAACRSSLYPVGRGGSPMPYCMFFTKYHAVHGSYEVPNYNASHGCIRIHPSDAKWLYHNFMEVGTPVIVKSY